MIEFKILHEKYSKEFSKKSKKIKQKYLQQLRTFKCIDENIISLQAEKRNFSKQVINRMAIQIPLTKHNDELYKLEMDFNAKKRELIRKMDQYKFIIGLKLNKMNINQ